MLMSFRTRIRQIDRRISGLWHAAPKVQAAYIPAGRRCPRGVEADSTCHVPADGRRTLGDALQASDLPDAAAVLVGPPKPTVLEHRQHRPRRMGKAPKAASGQAH